MCHNKNPVWINWPLPDNSQGAHQDEEVTDHGFVAVACLWKPGEKSKITHREFKHGAQKNKLLDKPFFVDSNTIGFKEPSLPPRQTAEGHQCWWALLQKRTGCSHRHTDHLSDIPFHTSTQAGYPTGWLLQSRNSSVLNQKEHMCETSSKIASDSYQTDLVTNTGDERLDVQLRWTAALTWCICAL